MILSLVSSLFTTPCSTLPIPTSPGMPPVRSSAHWDCWRSTTGAGRRAANGLFSSSYSCLALLLALACRLVGRLSLRRFLTMTTSNNPLNRLMRTNLQHSQETTTETKPPRLRVLSRRQDLNVQLKFHLVQTRQKLMQRFRSWWIIFLITVSTPTSTCGEKLILAKSKSM